MCSSNDFEYWLLYVAKSLCTKYDFAFDDRLLVDRGLTNLRNYKKIRSGLNKIVRISDPHNVAFSLMRLTALLKNREIFDYVAAIYSTIQQTCPEEVPEEKWQTVLEDLRFVITGKRN